MGNECSQYCDCKDSTTELDNNTISRKSTNLRRDMARQSFPLKIENIDVRNSYDRLSKGAKNDEKMESVYFNASGLLGQDVILNSKKCDERYRHYLKEAGVNENTSTHDEEGRELMLKIM